MSATTITTGATESHHATLGPARVKRYSEPLHAHILTGIGFRANCSCGWESKVAGSWTAAREAHAFHREQAHPTPPAPTVPPLAA